MRSQVSVKHKKRIALGFILLSLILMGLTFRVGWHQVVRADELTEMADEGKDAEITCQFCDTVYKFSPAEIRSLVAKAQEPDDEDEE